MNEAKDTVTVHVKYGQVEQTFTGNADAVWMSLNKFFTEMIPTYTIARKMALTVDLADLIEEASGAIVIAPEGPEVLLPKEKLTDSEALQFHLLGAYIAFRLGKRATDAMTKEELQAKLGKSAKITGTRLGELVKDGSVMKTDEDAYRLTTVAVKQLQGELKAIQKEIW